MSWRNIEHVVVLMMENLSFDRVLGWMTRPEHDVDGAVDGRANPCDPRFVPEGVVRVEAGASLVPPGAPHMPGEMFDELHGDGVGTNTGFARATLRTSWKRKHGLTHEGRAELMREVMRYHHRDDLPVTRDLALEFAVADRWFCPIASSTWPNRYFLHYGTSPTKALHLPQLGNHYLNIYQRLNEAGIPWRIYTDGPANIFACDAVKHEARRRRDRLLKSGKSRWEAAVIRPFGRFQCDFSPMPDLYGLEKEPPVPAYTFIEPRHWRMPGREADNDHSGTHLYWGQRLIATVYNRLRSNPAVWAKTLFIVIYDENGGYHDHVPPVPRPDPDTGIAATTPTPGTMGWSGARVPALLISPWIRQGAYHAVCDHTSVLAFLEKRFGLAPLTHRDALADDLTGAFQPLDRATVDHVVPPPAPPLAQKNDWRLDHTSLEVDLYKAMAAEAGADGESELASLHPDEVFRLGERRSLRYLA